MCRGTSFPNGWRKRGLTAQGIVAELKDITYIAMPTTILRVIEQDPDDDPIIACAVAAHAAMIVSGDKHL